MAGNVRAKAMLDRRIGSARARELAASGSLAQAQQILADSPYRHCVRGGQTLPEAEHALAATVLWHLRVLAGWQPRPGAGTLRLLAGWFEIANICAHARAVSGGENGENEALFALGALGTAWSRLRATSSVAELRHVLTETPWGDPGGDSPSDIAVGVGFAWARRVVVAVPEANDWACGGAALLVARRRFLEGRLLELPAQTNAERILGRRAMAAGSLQEFTSRLPPPARWALSGTADVGELWQAEFRWWSRVERDGLDLLRRPRFGSGPTVGAAAVLAADAWRCRAALQIAAGGGGSMEIYDAVA
ncbi:hypothetical protein MAUB_05200 [Mycolicibacterium aubagnense]|uniref:DNA-binding protein n=1 Tax=Mycolicibacterium aubagnense TaxID=319707 RepID=A0ABM7I7A1_9MYCO|nr:hypothetical protein MAUB_05200 [Mycolicibacterium aubagnense]